MLRQRFIAAVIMALALYFGVAAQMSNSAAQRKRSERPQAQLTVITGAEQRTGTNSLDAFLLQPVRHSCN